MKHLAFLIAIAVATPGLAQTSSTTTTPTTAPATQQPVKKKAASTTSIVEAPDKTAGKPTPPANRVERDATGKTCSGQDQYRVCW